MKINDRLNLTTAVIIILVVIVLSAVILTSNQIAKENEKHDLAMEVNTAAFELNAITYEYLLQHEKRMQDQWHLRYNSLGGILEKEGSLEEESTKSIRTDYIVLGDLFQQITKNYEKGQELIQEGVSQKEISATVNLEERLVAQLLIKSQSMSTGATRLAREAEASINEAQKLTNRLLLILMTILAIIVATTTFLTNRSITAPISSLLEGTEVIGTGNLDHKVEIKSHDEFGQLANSFNKMVFDIKSITASRDELDKEITERKKAEEALISANTELEAFSYSVSHDLRAPLRAIDGFSSAVLEDYSPKLDSEGQRYLNVISENAKKMGQLIDDLLAFSRLGRKEMTKSDVNMGKLAKAVFEELNSTAPNRKLRLKVKDIPPASGDKAMINQVFSNLLSNAIKFTRHKDTAIIEVGSNGEGDQNVYYVKDNGAGFDMKYVDKLFGVFQRLHSAEDFEGTGVGLALVKRIINRHGGKIWAEGEVGKGATFYFTIPQKRGGEKT